MTEAEKLPTEISVQQVDQLRKSDQPFCLLDVREPDEYQTARLEGAVLLPMSELNQRLEELKSHLQQRTIVYCHHGSRSLHVVMALRAKGYPNIQNMTGGIDRWSLQIDAEVPRY